MFSGYIRKQMLIIINVHISLIRINFLRHIRRHLTY